MWDCLVFMSGIRKVRIHCYGDGWAIKAISGGMCTYTFLFSSFKSLLVQLAAEVNERSLQLMTSGYQVVTLWVGILVITMLCYYISHKNIQYHLLFEVYFQLARKMKFWDINWKIDSIYLYMTPHSVLVTAPNDLWWMYYFQMWIVSNQLLEWNILALGLSQNQANLACHGINSHKYNSWIFCISPMKT